MERQKRWFKITIGTLIIVAVIGVFNSIYYHGFEETFKINFGEFFLSLATIMLAIVTYQLASYTYDLTLVEIEESKKGRDFNRLREKTTFYSELISGFPKDDIPFEDPKKIPDNINYSYFKFLRENSYAQRRYPIYCEPELNDLFKEAMPIITDMRDTHSYDKIKDKIPYIIQQIHEDFNKLKIEYEDF